MPAANDSLPDSAPLYVTVTCQRRLSPALVGPVPPVGVPVLPVPTPVLPVGVAPVPAVGPVPLPPVAAVAPDVLDRPVLPVAPDVLDVVGADVVVVVLEDEAGDDEPHAPSPMAQPSALAPTIHDLHFRRPIRSR